MLVELYLLLGTRYTFIGYTVYICGNTQFCHTVANTVIFVHCCTTVHGGAVVLYTAVYKVTLL